MRWLRRGARSRTDGASGDSADAARDASAGSAGSTVNTVSARGAPDSLRTVHALVSGEVQGVGYRWSCQVEAQQLNLVGQVRNLPDGDVEVLAQGRPDAVAALIAWLHRGPRWASVAGVIVTDLRPGGLDAQEFTVEF